MGPYNRLLDLLKQNRVTWILIAYTIGAILIETAGPVS